MNLKIWNLRLRTLTIFQHLKEDPVLLLLQKTLETNCQDTEIFVENYCHFVSALYDKDTNLSRYIYQTVLRDENVYVHAVAAKKEISPILKQSLQAELNLLQELSEITSKDLLSSLDYSGYLPEWETKSYDLVGDYYHHLKQLPKQGYGIFARYHAFGIQNHTLTPIRHPDPQKLEDLVGYEREREQIIKNTLAFMQGLDANNVLLYGDAGTGKSSTVKAIVNTYYQEGLRLIEVKKEQLADLPDILETLADNPLHFILFIDDLSFRNNDDNFVALKNILEGGIQHNHKNCVVYATSNRRHFVQENFKNREGGEIFRNDSIQETMSLAARFGLTVTFSKPLHDLYIEIVMELADRYGIQTDRKELAIQAEGYAIRNSGRSPRTAKQFIEYTKINEQIK